MLFRSDAMGYDISSLWMLWDMASLLCGCYGMWLLFFVDAMGIGFSSLWMLWDVAFACRFCNLLKQPLHEIVYFYFHLQTLNATTVNY